MQQSEPIWHYVAPSALHGRGVFAQKLIPQGTYIMEYQGKRISSEEADNQPSADPDNPYHTFFFALSDGTIIDGGQGGNDARWINHSCAPNCEGYENEAGDKVYIVAKRDIQPHEELLYDYALTIDEPLTKELKENYACWCGAPNCRATMLALQDTSTSEQELATTGEPTALMYSSPPLPVILRRLRPYIRREIRQGLRQNRRLRRRRRQRRLELLKRGFDETS